jgi:putative membrane protein
MPIETAQLGADCGESRTLGASIAFSTALVLALFVFWSAASGPRSAHMAAHIFVMNALAPIMALGAARCGFLHGVFGWGRALAAGAILQIAILYAWHAPGVIAGVENRPIAHAAMHMALFASAFAFWLAILSLAAAALWRGVLALAVTGKLACLLGALLLLAPRLIDRGAGGGSGDALDDQHMAGLMMLAACPFCYLLTAVGAASKWLRFIEARASRLDSPPMPTSGTY